jgi:hypothetical protein
MIGRKQRHAALAVLVLASRRYGDRCFKVDPAGQNYRPLRDAESLGWVRFSSHDYAALTPAGLAEANGYERPRTVVSYVCQVCGSVVGQPPDAEGLPVNTRCPVCERMTDEAVLRLRHEVPA